MQPQDPERVAAAALSEVGSPAAKSISGALNVMQVSDLPQVTDDVRIVRTSQHNLNSRLGAALYRKVDAEPAHNLKEPARGGGWWEISEPRIDVTMAGAIGDATSGSSGYDNGSVMADVYGYASLLGGDIYVPRGCYRTSIGAMVTMADEKKTPGLLGAGPGASCFISGAGDVSLLTIEGCARTSIQKVGFYKDATTDGGMGLVVSRTPWCEISQVAAEGRYGSGGFERGVYLNNSLSSKIDLVCRDNVYGLYADYLIDGEKFVSRPNALRISGEFGRNKRWGLRIDEAGVVDFKGVIEGNGWGVSDDFRGGMYLANAGTESGVGVNIRSTYFEANAGRADVYIAQVINGGTVYNIEDSSFASLDMVHYVQNHIYVENSVYLALNVRGNRFESLGSYVPDVMRRAILASAPADMTLNLGGDKHQFAHAVEYPVAFGAMGLNFGGQIADNGMPVSMPAEWSCVRTAVGTYTIAMPVHLTASDFAFTASVMDGNVRSVQRLFTSGNLVSIITVNVRQQPADASFCWTAIGIR
ncbi:hypothetical protein BC361_32105 [Ensifer sp. LC54]|nr:hypothetical protein BC361_32105 [Ensifer sp. LC54]OCP18670.1 hypothetical protein BC363_31955 [Ensifer sp. LC384]